ncbi:MAG: Asp-tRNA(Asn)/Glu-tRNA(Gln) amidotransferase subunit GatB [Deltaproteobacteria bacterium]|nr:Asp-tRNA(Asn)/Glu-tRNA(Gln) amidotransferase subunit GatB [Deltaproteobacteria bacterium]
MTRYEPVIGLEVHAQLRTQSKLFCSCSTAFGADVNLHTCAVCLGMPGVLPVLNRHAVDLAIRAGLGLGCTIHPRSQWSRKNYFYPDLPKGYQISQYDQPIATDGQLIVEVDGATSTVRIMRIHMEEDAAKNVHDDLIAGNRSYVDFNRGGTPLVEIVSQPDIRSAAQAAAYMKTLRQILRYLGVCDGNMEEGSLRCDANVSIRPVGETKLGTRTELKNINSFRFVQQAIEYEIERQKEVLASGGTIVQETRLWDTQAKVTRSMRSKEEAHDYRYFPDPDLPNLVLEPSYIENIRTELPELPAAKLKRYTTELGLSNYDANILTEDAEIALFFEKALAVFKKPKAIANWVINEVLRKLKTQNDDTAAAATLTDAYAQQIGELVELVEDNIISGKIAKDIFADLKAGDSPKRIVDEHGLKQVSDVGSIEPLIDEVLAKNPESVAKYKAGRTNMLGFFVGQVMKQTGGKANPKLVNELIQKKLS